MKTLKLAMLLALTLQTLSHAGEARFFRITGPVAVTLTACSADGYVTWTNAPTNATFTVQTARTLLGPSNWVDYVQVPATNPVTIHRLFDLNPPTGMVFIPAGSFTMGNCMGTNEGSADELPLHMVNVSAFYMDKHEVTKLLWDEVYQWATNHGYSFDNTGSGKATNHPVHTVLWRDVVKWCNARSEKEGQVPAYYTEAARTNVYRTGWPEVENDWVNWTAGYRLPTEAEWEKAARGGLNGKRFPWGDTITHSQANYYSRAIDAYDTSPTRGYHPTYATGDFPYTSPVGSFAANGYGLFDMAGNVWEWCWDWYDSYSSGSQTDPRGPAASGSGERALRGGYYKNYAQKCRTANRTGGYSWSKGDYYGFRCVRGL